MTLIGSITFAALPMQGMSSFLFVHVHHITVPMASFQYRSTIPCWYPQVHLIQKLFWTEANDQPFCLRLAPAPIRYHCKFSHYDCLTVLIGVWSALYVPCLFMPQSLVHMHSLFSLLWTIAGSSLPHPVLQRSHFLRHPFPNSQHPFLRIQAFYVFSVAFSPSLENDARSGSTSDQTSKVVPNMVSTLQQYMDCGLVAGQIRTKAAPSGFAPGKGVYA
jgi:hypothetical protein